MGQKNRQEMISIIDYGVGNISAVSNIYKRLNIPVQVVRTPQQLLQAHRLILPGVGSFDWTMARLNGSGMRDVLDKMVLGQKKPVLGICVGMQMMAKRSDEGSQPGLGWFDAEVRRLDKVASSGNLFLPHMGWNDVEPRHQNGLFRDIGSTGRFYFLHSYYFAPNNKEEVLAVTQYGGKFASSIQSGNIFGVQFHPEKSHQWGVQLLKNFAELENAAA
jgi:glutamine amidotransferase